MAVSNKRLEEISKEVEKITGGVFCVTAKEPDSMKASLPKSHKTFRELPVELQNQFGSVESLHGKHKEYIFQMSNGLLQVKRYEPEKYQNSRNTPLRQRMRTIMQLAAKEPPDKQHEKLRELYRTFPYSLLREEQVNLRLSNFYFNKKMKEQDPVKIYKTNNPGNPDPQTDILYAETEYRAKKTIPFSFQTDETEYWYAVNQRNGNRSNILTFVWG